MKTTKYRGDRDEARALGAYVKLMRAAESVLARATRHLRKEGITVSQFGVMDALYHLGPLSQREVASKVLRTSGNMTMVVDNLVKRGLVERDRSEEDRRVYRLSLSSRGSRLMEKLFPRHAAIIEQEMSILTPQEQETLSRLCRSLGLGNRGKDKEE